ncbi:MAG: hypothetical protein [Bacteriophage sp.]|nr:MAG: hypothetical protein [Bacteriophage sp.]
MTIKNLQVNCFAKETDSSVFENAEMVYNLNPFADTEHGKVPRFLSDALYRSIIYGVNFNRKGKEISIDGKQISRCIELHGLIMQLQILQETAEATDVNIAINIENCGKLGIFLIRQLVSHLPNLQFNFIGFNKFMVEKLNALQPLENPIYYNYLLRPRDENVVAESVTLVGAEIRQPVGKTPTKKVTVEKTSAVIENLKEPIAEEASAIEEVVETVSEEVVEEEKPVKKKATRKTTTKKKVVEEEGTPLNEEELVEAVKKLKTAK